MLTPGPVAHMSRDLSSWDLGLWCLDLDSARVTPFPELASRHLDSSRSDGFPDSYSLRALQVPRSGHFEPIGSALMYYILDESQVVFG